MNKPQADVPAAKGHKTPQHHASAPPGGGEAPLSERGMDTTTTSGGVWGCIVCCCGLPATGKTSFCREAVKEANGRGYRATHVCFDEVASSACGHGSRFDPEEWKKGRRSALATVAKLARTEDGKKCPVLLLVDDNMQYRSMRHEIMRIACQAGLGFVTAYFDVAVDEALRHNRGRNHVEVVPDKVIQKMTHVLEPPQMSRNSWEKHFLSVKNVPCGTVPLELWTLVRESMASPLPGDASIREEVSDAQRNLDREITSHSIRHTMDIALRREIGCIMARAKEHLGSTFLRELGEFCASARSTLLMSNPCIPVDNAEALLLNAILHKVEERFSSDGGCELRDFLLSCLDKGV
jgi:tRNA uridine 5-carbamoylmethylation protein Kti12